jgi:integrase
MRFSSRKPSPFLEKGTVPWGGYLDRYEERMPVRGCPALTPVQYKLAKRGLRGRHRWRNRALLVLMVRTGLRISEALALRVEQAWDGKAVVPRLYLNRKDTKGKRTGASIIIHPEAAAALAKWLQTRENVDGSEWLFPSQVRPDQPIVRHTGWQILHDAFIAVGVTGMAGSHSARKTFSANVYRALKGDLFRLSKALRHTNPLTPLAYLSFRQDEIDRAILRT